MSEELKTNGVAMVTVSLAYWETVKNKAEKWDALEAKIASYYPEDCDLDDDAYDDNDDDINDEGGDLLDIGEAAARAFGFM